MPPPILLALCALVFLTLAGASSGPSLTTTPESSVSKGANYEVYKLQMQACEDEEQPSVSLHGLWYRADVQIFFFIIFPV